MLRQPASCLSNPYPLAQDKLHKPSDQYARVVATAAQLFAEKGFAQVSMRDLAARLGMGAGSLYHHIDSKEALLEELLETLYCKLLTGAGQLCRQAMGAMDLLIELIQSHLAVQASMPHHFKIAEQDLHCLNECQRNAILALRSRYEACFASVLGQLRPSTCLQNREVAIALVLILNQLPTRIQASSTLAHSDDARAVTAIARAVVNAVM